MKRIICIFLCAILCLSNVSVSASAVERTSHDTLSIPTTGDVWDGSITQPTTLVQKDGVYYYEITKCAELAYVAQTGGNWLNANYILGNDLIFNDTTIEWDKTGNLLTSSENLNEWTPIGSIGGSYFSGSFCGNGYLISGIFVDSGTDVGLFAELNDEGTIDGITLMNSYLTGKSCIGGIVGYNNGGLIRNCNNYSGVFSAGGIAGGICGSSRYTDYYSNVIRNCANYGDVFSKGNHVGGIVGKSSRDNIRMCTNYGNICADGNYVGGIVGFADTYPSIWKNANYGTVIAGSYVGGICGQAEGETYLTQCISDCYNVGEVRGADSIGGILGNGLSCKLESCYNLANIDGTSNIGAIVGYTDSIFGKSKESYNYYLNGCVASGRGNTVDVSGEVESKSVIQLKNKICYVDWDFDTIWSISTELNDGYPYFQREGGVLAPSKADISGTVSGLSGGACAILMQNGAELAQAAVVNGSFTFKDLAAGTYDVVIQCPACLNCTIQSITLSGDDVTLAPVALTYGDLNGDQKINIGDMGIFRQNFGKTAANCIVNY